MLLLIFLLQQPILFGESIIITVFWRQRTR